MAAMTRLLQYMSLQRWKVCIVSAAIVSSVILLVLYSTLDENHIDGNFVIWNWPAMSDLSADKHDIKGRSPLLCPSYPEYLKDPKPVDLQVTIQQAEEAILNGSVVTKGGSWEPTDCLARWAVAIIAPYRSRPKQVGPFLKRMHQLLQIQQLHYTIYIIEQTDTRPFNRASLMNVGYLEAINDEPWDCYAFHDIDLLPENDRNLYHCFSQPLHLTVALSSMNYNEIYPANFGGACLLTGYQFTTINGFSNRFWGWGGEDDDLYNRVRNKDFKTFRYPASIGRYTVNTHEGEVANPERVNILNNKMNILEDGFTTLNYTVVSRQLLPLFTMISVNLFGNKIIYTNNITTIFSRNITSTSNVWSRTTLSPPEVTTWLILNKTN